MTINKRMLKSVLSITLMLLLMSSGLLTYAETATENTESQKSEEKILNEKPSKEINLVELRNLFISNNSDLRDAKTQLSSLGEMLDGVNGSYINMLYGGDRSSGMKEQRRGSYYEFAYPTFVQKMNNEVNYEVMDISVSVAETGLSYSADAMLAQYSQLKENLELMDKQIILTEKSYGAVVKKEQLGNISKVDAENSKIQLENLKYQRDQIYYKLKALEYSIMSTAGLESDMTYKFQAPIFTPITFDSSRLSEYFESAKRTSTDLLVANRQLEALENEASYVKNYKSLILKSDLLDFDRRYADGVYKVESTESEIYKAVKDLLSEYNKVIDEINVAQTQIDYDKAYLKKLDQMEKLGQVIDTDRMSSEIKVFNSEIQKQTLVNQRNLLTQKMDLLITYGIKL